MPNVHARLHDLVNRTPAIRPVPLPNDGGVALARLHQVVNGYGAPATRASYPTQPGAPSPILPGQDLHAALHYWANPGSSGNAMAMADSASQSFADGQVVRGPDGTLVAYGQAGYYGRAQAFALAHGETHGNNSSAEGMAYAKAEAGLAAYVRGAFVKTSNSVMAMGEATFEAIARTEVGARGRSGIGRMLLSVDAYAQGAAEVGLRAKATGMAYLGLDSMGMPGIELGGSANGMAGGQAEGMAGTNISLLGLVTLHVGGAARGIAGAAGGVLGHFKFRDGILSLGVGANAAAGVGGHVATEVGVGLGPIPKGVVMMTVAPVIQAPILLMNSIGKLLGIAKEKPGEFIPDLSDYPALVAHTFTSGAKMIGQGALDLARDIADTTVEMGKGLVHGAGFVAKSVGDGVVGAVNGIGTGIGFIGKSIGKLFSGW